MFSWKPTILCRSEGGDDSLDKCHRAAQFTVGQSIRGCAAKIPSGTLGEEDILRKGTLCCSCLHKPGGSALLAELQKQIKH